MDKGHSPIARPTFKRTLRRISIISVLVTMMLIWLLLSISSVLALRQYAQKNLDLTAATMTRTLEAALVFLIVLQQLKRWRHWASRGNFLLQKFVIKTRR